MSRDKEKVDGEGYSDDSPEDVAEPVGNEGSETFFFGHEAYLLQAAQCIVFSKGSLRLVHLFQQNEPKFKGHTV